MEFLYSKKLKCAPRGEEDDAMHPLGRGSVRQAHTLFYPNGTILEKNILQLYPSGINMFYMNRIGNYIKEERKKAGLTQEEFALRSGLGLRFVRELEHGKETVRLDKVNQALAMFGCEAVPGKKER